MDSVADDTVIEPAKLVARKMLAIERDFFSMVPNIVAALAFLLVAWVMAKALARVINHLARERGRPDLGNILAALGQWLLAGVAVMLAATIVVPSLGIGAVFSTLGIGSVAISFAFKDILQNLFSGLLILIHRPYRPGDIVRIREMEGIVEAIESGVTVLRTLDGRKLLIPNSDVYTSPVTVITAYATRRDEFRFQIDYSHPPEEVIRHFTAALAQLARIEREPAIAVQVSSFKPTAIELAVYWWTHSTGNTRVDARSAVIDEIYRVASAHNIRLAVAELDAVQPNKV